MKPHPSQLNVAVFLQHCLILILAVSGIVGCLELPTIRGLDSVSDAADSAAFLPLSDASATAFVSTADATTPNSSVNRPDQSVGDMFAPSTSGEVDALLPTMLDASVGEQQRPQVEFPDCVAETEPLPMAVDGEWGPSSRLTLMDIPLDPDAAKEAGCEVLGYNVGSGLQGLISLLDTDLTSQLHPDMDDVINVILLVHLKGWMSGQTANQASPLTLNVYQGVVLEEDRWLVSKASFEMPLVDRVPRATFPAEISGCRLVTEPGNFTLDLPEISAGGALTLVNTTIRAHLESANDGFNIVKGTVTGYLTDQVLTNAVLALADSCDGERPPSACNIVGSLVTSEDPLETVRRLLLPLLGGADVRVDNGRISEDCDDACNAVSVCILVEGVSTPITGLNTCTDNLINGNETNADCGGHCPPCSME